MEIQTAQQFVVKESLLPTLPAVKDQRIRMIHLQEKRNGERVIIGRAADQLPCLPVSLLRQAVELRGVDGLSGEALLRKRRKRPAAGERLNAPELPADTLPLNARQIQMPDIPRRTIRTVRQQRMLRNNRAPIPTPMPTTIRFPVPAYGPK